MASGTGEEVFGGLSHLPAVAIGEQETVLQRRASTSGSVEHGGERQGRAAAHGGLVVARREHDAEGARITECAQRGDGRFAHEGIVVRARGSRRNLAMARSAGMRAFAEGNASATPR